MHRNLLAVVVAAACASHSTVPREDRGPGPEEIDPPTALEPGACDDAPLYTFEVAAGKGEGERMALDVVPKATRVCTRKGCPGQACCNRCTGPYVINEIGLELAGLAGCDGMDCNFHCEPFGREPTTTYRFVGTKTSARSFSVEKYCRL